MYGQTDLIISGNKARKKAINLLLAVAEEKKTVADVRAWLKKNYPELCTKTKKEKKW